MKEITFNSHDYNNNVWIDDNLYVVADNFQLVELIKDKLGYDLGKFMETLFNTQMLNSDEIEEVIVQQEKTAVEDFKDMEINPICDKVCAILDDYPIEKISDFYLKDAMTRLEDVATMFYDL